MSLNKVFLIGNVGKDPEIRYVENNVPVARFTLATNETYISKNGEKVTNTEWHNIVLWRGLAETAEKYVKKGSQIFIEGKINNRTWNDKDGNKRYTTDIVGNVMQLLGSRTSGEQISSQPTDEIENQTIAEQSMADDDLPF